MSTNRLLSEKRGREAGASGAEDPVIVTDDGHRVLMLNHAAEALFGIGEERARGRHLLEAIGHWGLVSAIQARGAGEPDGGAAIALGRGAGRAFYRVQVTPVRDEAGRVTGRMTQLVDVARLREAQARRTELVSTVAHEFRSPLTSMTMAVNLLLEDRDGRLSGRQRELLEVIAEDSERLTGMVNNLLELSRLESGRIRMEPRPVEVEDLVEGASRPFFHQAEEKGVRLVIEVPPGLPRVSADPVKMPWVLSNLISNALRHTPGGGEIRVRARLGGATVYVSVADTGIGIPKEYQGRIFERFIQVKRGEGAPPGGMGLGLCISKEIVEAHGGTIWVDSAEGKGTTFTFTLSAAAPDGRGG